MLVLSFICRSFLTSAANLLAVLAIWMIAKGCWIFCTRNLRPWWYLHFGIIDGRLARVILSPSSGSSVKRRAAAQDFVALYREQVDGLLTELELSSKPKERLRLLDELRTVTARHGSFFISKRLSYRLQLQLARQALAEGHSLKEARLHLRGVGNATLFESVTKYYHLTS